MTTFCLPEQKVQPYVSELNLSFLLSLVLKNIQHFNVGWVKYAQNVI